MKIQNIAEQRMRRDAVALKDKMREAEDRSDSLLEGTADLMKAMVKARRSADVPPHMGQTAIMRLVRAQQSIVAGANDLFRVHDELSTIGVELAIMDEGGATPKFASLELASASSEAEFAQIA